MQYIPCNSALLAQEALFLPKKALFMPKDFQKKSAYIATNLNSRRNSVCSGLKFLSASKLFSGCHPRSRATSATLSHTKLSPTQIPEHLKMFLFWFCFQEDEWYKKETSSRISLGRKFANRLLVNILLSAIAFFLRIRQWQENNIMQLYLRIVIVLTLNQLT